MKKISYLTLTGLAFAVAASHAALSESSPTLLEKLMREVKVEESLPTLKNKYSPTIDISPLSQLRISPLSSSSSESSLSSGEELDFDGKMFFEALEAFYSDRSRENKERISNLTEILERYYKSGCNFNINYQNENGLTSLHLAVKHKDATMAIWFVNKLEANCQLLDINGYSPLVMALQDLSDPSYQDIYKRMMTSFKKSEFLKKEKPYKICYGRSSEWRESARNSTPIYDSPSVRSKDDVLFRTHLHIIMQNGDYEQFERWLDEGILTLSHLRQQDLIGNTPLMSVLEFVKDPLVAYKLAKLLEDYRAPLHAINVDGVRVGDALQALEDKVKDLLSNSQQSELDTDVAPKSKKVKRQISTQDLDHVRRRLFEND